MAYEYHLSVHCGIRAARFGGRDWAAVAPVDELSATSVRPPDPNHLLGSMTLVAPDLARFARDGDSADFTPCA